MPATNLPSMDRHLRIQMLSAWFFRLLSLIAFLAILSATAAIWPTDDLGYDVDPLTRTIIFVAAGRPAARAGVQVGDEIVSVYGLSWDDVVHHWNVLSLEAPWRPTVIVEVEREGHRQAFNLVRQPASTAYQLAKAKFLLLGLCCWLTGYLVGSARRHQVAGWLTIPVFWFALSLVLGTYPFTLNASWPLHVCVLWVSVTVLAPLGVYMHLWYPSRPSPKETVRRGRTALLATISIANSIFLAFIVTTKPSLAALYATLGSVVAPIAFSTALAMSGVLLFAAYRRVAIAHSRRQIRVIAGACVIVATCWFLSFILEDVLGLDVSVTDGLLGFLVVLVPLSYLYSGIVPNLRRVDRIVTRCCAAIVAAVGIIAVLSTVTWLLELNLIGSLICVAIGLLLFYRTVYNALVALTIEHDRSRRVYQEFQRAARQLTTTLDSDALINILLEAVRNAFHNPACAFYLGTVNDTNHLRLARRWDLASLPEVIESGELAAYLCRENAIVETRTLHLELATDQLSPVEQAAVYCPDVALWCPVCHAEGHLLGVMVIGADPNLDPYHQRDFTELRRLIDGAVLAFTNSVAYQRQCEAEETIRHLYTSLQQAQDETAAAIARELHDEIINISVRLNIQSLRQLLAMTHEPAVRTELVALLESEQGISQSLRMVCERLQPSGTSDPFGLPSVLRQHLERVEGTWSGCCSLVVEGDAAPIGVHQQREALHIVREAVANAMQHAMATSIVVTLQYPVTERDPVRLTVSDDGTSGHRITARDGHWGLRNMVESARVAKGHVTFQRSSSGGTMVIFTFPPM